MKIEKELLEDHQIRLHVEFEAEPFEQAKHRAARKIAQKVKIPGFRPGKAPYNVVVRQVGEAAVVEEAMEGFIDDVYPKMLKEAEIRPYGPGSLEKVIGLEPPTFDFVVPLEPEVELGDYKALEIAYEIPEVNEAEIEAEINQLRQQQSITETSTEPAEEGDRVFYSVSAERAEAVEGQETSIIPLRFNSLMIEAEGDHQNQWPFPGFSVNLKGMTINAEKDLFYTYPEDHEDENLQGVEAVFHVTVTNIQKVSLPEADDEFAKAASDFDTLEELKADIRQKLTQKKQNEYDSEYNDLVLDTLVEQSTIKFPPQMLEEEKKEMLSNLEYRLSQQGLSFDLYLQIRNMSREELEEEIDPLAQNRIRRGLVLAEVAKAENMQIDSQQLVAETNRTMEIVTRGMSAKDVKEFRKSDYLNGLVSSIMTDMMTQKSINYLRAIAKGDPLPEDDATEPEAEEASSASEDDATPAETAALPTSDDAPAPETELESE